MWQWQFETQQKYGWELLQDRDFNPHCHGAEVCRVSASSYRWLSYSLWTHQPRIQPERRLYLGWPAIVKQYNFGTWEMQVWHFELRILQMNNLVIYKKTRSTRPIDAKFWKKLCLWIMFNIKIFHHQTPPHKRFKIFLIFWNVL